MTWKRCYLKIENGLVNGQLNQFLAKALFLRQFDPRALRREVSVILQDYAQYDLTARENIWLGDLNLSSRDDKIYTAARQTRADEFLLKLPRGFETVLGHEFEDQGELSQGEWQKVALVRAFMREE